MGTGWGGLRAWGLGLLLVLATGARAETIITLSFDDGHISHRQAMELLAPYRMRATFYIITDRVGVDPAVMTLEDLRALAAAGHEIGSHTLTHRRLTDLRLEERRRELCESRATLQAWGFSVDTLGYPLDAFDAETQQLVAECGYVAARQTNGLGSCTTACPAAEPIPPADLLAIRTAPTLQRHHTLDDLKRWVTAAEEAGGGWLNVVFHRVVEDCSELTYCSTPTLLRDFLAWLAPRSALGTHVRTVREVVRGEAPPSPSGSALQVLTPNGGETLAPDTEVAVTWATVGQVPQVDVAYTVDEGASWTPIAAATDNGGSVLWRVPRLDGVHGWVRVASSGEGAVADVSDAPFFIGYAPPAPPTAPPPGTSVEEPLTGVGRRQPPPDGAGCSQSASLSALPLPLLAALALRRRARRRQPSP